MHGAGWLQNVLAWVGFLIVAYAAVRVAELVGRTFEMILNEAFGRQMRAQFGEEPRVPVPDDVQPLRDRGAL
jgi:hypothetical protein